MAYVQCGTITKEIGSTSLGMAFSATLYVDRSTTPFSRRIYIDKVTISYPASYNTVRTSNCYFRIWCPSTSSYVIDTQYTLSTPTQIGNRYYQYTPVIGYINLPATASASLKDYTITASDVITYKRTSSSSYDVVTVSISSDIRYPDYAGISISAPSTVKLNALNQFSCPAIDFSRIYKKASTQTFTAYGAFGQSYERLSDIYVSPTQKLTRDSSFSALYWYPSILAAQGGDFINNTSRYKIYFELVDTDCPLDDNRIAWGEITGTIQYNETPPSDANPAVSVSVTEVSGAGLFARYGRYLTGKSRIRLRASISAPYGYGQSILSRTITLNGVTSTADTTIWPAVDGTYYAYALDNHNASNSDSLSYQVYDYWDPELATFAIHRCQQDGTNDDAGAYVKIEWEISVAPLGDQNSMSLTITHPQGTTTPTLTDYDESGVLIVAADIEHSYDITAALTDDLGSVTRTLRLSTAGAIMDIHNGGDGIAFGKVAELADTLEVTPNWEVILNTTDAKKISLVDALVALATAAGVDIYVHDNSQTGGTPS